MMGQTHRVGGMLCALAGYTYLESKGMLIADVSPLVQLTIMYPFAIYGSTFPDLDHNTDSIPSKDIFSLLINKILHLTSGIRERSGKDLKGPLAVFDARHRSWQTHSDLFLLICIVLSITFIGGDVSTANGIILKLVVTGFMLGLVSHMILDIITPAGIWCIGAAVLSKVTKSRKFPVKIHLVPHSRFFATGGTWETIVRYFMWVACILLMVRIIWGMLPYRIVFS